MRVKVFKRTTDDWCGSYHLERQDCMLVEVIFNGNIGNGMWRTCVWGNDDCGMEFDCATETECWNKFLQVIGMDFVDMVALRDLGFVSA